MNALSRHRRAGLIGLSALTIAAGGLLASAHGALAAGTKTSAPANQHAYRHGAFPTKSAHAGQKASPTASTAQLEYGGGVNGVGVTTGAEKVYLIFWGSQWGTAGTNGSGYTTFSGDNDGGAPVLQAMFKGLGSNNELWSGVMTQYCEGVAAQSVTCPANSAHVGYPGSGGALAGVWYDDSAAAPNQASGHDLGAEAVKAAQHFGNNDSTANRSAQYVVLSPTGTHPDGFNQSGTSWCAWHDYTGDTSLDGGGSVSSPVGDIAFTNMPYVMDQGRNCGQGFVNSPGTLDGYTMVEGHEYAETITDQFPSGGWTEGGNTTTENADKCAWISSGAGAAANLSLSTGSFTEQGTWANDANSGSGGCLFTHPIVGGGTGGNTVTVTNPGDQSTVVNTSASLQIQAKDSSSSAKLTYAATGLPAGLSIDSGSGLISGTPTTVGTSSVKVTVTDDTKAASSASFTWNVTSSGGHGTVTVTNPGDQWGFVGWNIFPVQIQAGASDGGALTFSAAGLPPGLSISAGGTISGTPTASGNYSVTVTASESNGAKGSTTFAWSVY